MGYLPAVQTHPSEVRDTLCSFYYQGEWNLSEKAIYEEAKAVRLSRESEVEESGLEPYHELMRVAIKLATSNVAALVAATEGYQSLGDFFDFADPKGLQPLNRKGWQTRVNIIYNAGRDLAWLLHDADSSTDLLGVTFEECCTAESAAIRVDAVQEHVRGVIQAWLERAPTAVSALKWYVEQTEPACV